MRLTIVSTVFAALAFHATPNNAAASSATFSFADYPSLEDMGAFVRASVKLKTPRDAIRQIFVSEGGAFLFEHPELKDVEKYVYDINLCQLYIWRWNLSANFDVGGKLTQLYINGEPVHGDGDPAVDHKSRAKPGLEPKIYRGSMPRPEASRGESSLAYVLLDVDPASGAVSDEFVIGGGPSRADPANLGKLHVYSDVEMWRSIFADETPSIANYAGKCP